MHAAAKLIIGIIIFLAGIYWYAVPTMMRFVGVDMTTHALSIVFAGVFGLILIVVGLIVAWIEIEDLRWARHEKQAKKKK